MRIFSKIIPHDKLQIKNNSSKNTDFHSFENPRNTKDSLCLSFGQTPIATLKNKSLLQKIESKFGLYSDYKNNEFCAEFQRQKLKIKDFLARIEKDGFYYGEGKEGKVYSIPISGFEDYVIKISPFKDIYAKLKPVKISLPEENFGQTVAKIGHHKILKKIIYEESAGISQLERSMNSYRVTEQFNKLFTDKLRRIAALPQSAFDDFARQLKLLHEADIWVDPAPNNLLIDYSKGKIYITDLKYPGYIRKNEHLLDAMFLVADPIYGKDWFNSELFPITNEVKNLFTIIIKKIIPAGKKYNLSTEDPNNLIKYSFEIAGRSGELNRINRNPLK